jgi:hypothetical protein
MPPPQPEIHMADPTPRPDPGTPPQPASSPDLPDALRPEKADVRALKNPADLKSAAPSEGSGVAGNPEGETRRPPDDRDASDLVDED